MGRDAFENMQAGGSIPQQRVIEKLDEYLGRRDTAGAERHLLYWLDEARALGDRRGELMVRNELVGHFRKAGDGERSLSHGEAALRLVDELGFGNTTSAGTTFTNVATACNAFGHDERALELFAKAAALFEGDAGTDGRLLGGLYNNMGLTCVALGSFDEADALYAKALDVMSRVEHGELEQAITYLNMADAVIAKAQAQADATGEGASTVPDVGVGSSEGGAAGQGVAPGAALDAKARVRASVAGEGAKSQDAADAAAERAEVAQVDECAEREIAGYLDKAYALIDTPTVPRDGYYAFVCEKCAPTFGYYGYFLADAELRKRAEEIYERP